jgi:hypothetical protein
VPGDQPAAELPVPKRKDPADFSAGPDFEKLSFWLDYQDRFKRILACQALLLGVLVKVAPDVEV